MRVCLVSMPWHLLETPCLPIGLLRARVGACRDPHTVVDYYGNLRWAEYLLDVSGGQIAEAEYSYVADRGVWHAMGEWIFAGALYDDPAWRVDTYRAYLEARNLEPGASLRMREHAAGFVELAAREILRERPDLVGFTTTFQQNVSSLAVARRIKQLRPDVQVVFGGGNCDGPMGAALHRNFPFVDHVVSGEGELAFVALLDALSEGRAPAGVPGVVTRGPDGESVAGPPAAMVPIDMVPRPDFTAWWSAYGAGRFAERLSPVLLYEASRGCWWGEKHHCTFCGLNGTTMKFRAKPATRVWDDITHLVETHGVLDIVTVDNILDLAYLAELMPRIRESGWDLRVRYEVKANLKPDQLAVLRDAGVTHIQPGIESLNSRALRLMDKGVHGTQNVFLLRASEEHQLTVDWNYLYGFPDERAGDYRPVIEQIPAMVHLQPPSGSVRVLIERFSPHFRSPERGFAERRPSRMYQHAYDLPESELEDLAYQFEAPPQGIGEDVASDLRAAIAAWRHDHAASTLTWRETEDGLVIDEGRAGRPRCEYVLSDPAQARSYRLLERPRTIAALARELAAEGFATSEETLRKWVGELRGAGLVFEDDGRVVALATDRRPLRVAEGG
ncbi:RiPP maturation radical SAM C-methyltransferase [Actinoallomurus oryzae]|uniref:RiPP maturation radical SAM C-methyltransferase n=1 Tax=Actinoallomurus oryzae TaxID=502180 RepID=A0ABP8PYG6_9ACTN